MTVEDVAGDVTRELEAATLGTVVAVWRSDEVSTHRHLGFCHRLLPDGSREEPLTSFVKAQRAFSLEEVTARIERALSLQRRS